METFREEEFAPVKNAPGTASDSQGPGSLRKCLPNPLGKKNFEKKILIFVLRKTQPIPGKLTNFGNLVPNCSFSPRSRQCKKHGEPVVPQVGGKGAELT